MKRDKAIRLLIADDHTIVREGLITLLGRQPDMRIIGEASNGEEALALYRSHRPDITLMDLRMPLMDGVQAITTIRAEFPTARIIILTSYDGDEDIYRGLRAGAMAYLLKTGSREELLETIYRVREGLMHIPAEVAKKLAERMTTTKLTPRELEVLEHMADGQSNQEISRALCISESTVKVHVTSILHKMQVNDRTQAVTMALRRGLVHP